MNPINSRAHALLTETETKFMGSKVVSVHAAGNYRLVKTEDGRTHRILKSRLKGIVDAKLKTQYPNNKVRKGLPHVPFAQQLSALQRRKAGK